MSIPRVLIKKGDSVVDIYSQYNIVVTHFPFIFPNAKPKNISSRSYFDENGDYEYIPDVITYAPQEFTVNFAYKGIKDSANINILSFINFLMGEISIYSEFAKIGRQKCRAVSISDDAKMHRGNKDVVEFSIRFKCNDPTNNITLSL